MAEVEGLVHSVDFFSPSSIDDLLRVFFPLSLSLSLSLVKTAMAWLYENSPGWRRFVNYTRQSKR